MRWVCDFVDRYKALCAVLRARVSIGEWRSSISFSSEPEMLYPRTDIITGLFILRLYFEQNYHFFMKK